MSVTYPAGWVESTTTPLAVRLQRHQCQREWLLERDDHPERAAVCRLSRLESSSRRPVKLALLTATAHCLRSGPSFLRDQLPAIKKQMEKIKAPIAQGLACGIAVRN